MARITSYRETGERYATLRIVGTLCAGLGVLLIVVGGLLLAIGVASLFTDQLRPINTLGIWIALVWSIGFFLSGLQSLAMGAFFRLAIHVEENTRATAQALDKIRAGLDPKEVNLDVRSIFLS